MSIKVRLPYEKFAHYNLGRGHATLSVGVDGNDVNVGVSFCHPRDVFFKRFGREVAYNRRTKESVDFSFSFERDHNIRLNEQLRLEFENYVLRSFEPRIRQRLNRRNSEDWKGAPSWAIFALRRQLRKEIKNSRHPTTIHCC